MYSSYLSESCVFQQILSYFTCDSGFRVGMLLYHFHCFQSVYAEVCIVSEESDPVTLISIKDVHACKDLELQDVSSDIWRGGGLLHLSSSLSVCGRRCSYHAMDYHRRYLVSGPSLDSLHLYGFILQSPRSTDS